MGSDTKEQNTKQNSAFPPLGNTYWRQHKPPLRGGCCILPHAKRRASCDNTATFGAAPTNAFTTAATVAKQGSCRAKMSRCTMQKQHQGCAASAQQDRARKAQHADQDKNVIFAVGARERPTCTVLRSRHVLQPCLLCTERNFFNRKTIDFSVKMVKIFFAGLPPRTPVRTHTPVSRYTSPPPRACTTVVYTT